MGNLIPSRTLGDFPVKAKNAQAVLMEPTVLKCARAARPARACASDAPPRGARTAHARAPLPARRYELRPEDRYLVIGSDGVFDVLSNRAVAKIVSHAKQPGRACNELMRELHKRGTLDDATVIVALLAELREPTDEYVSAEEFDAAEAAEAGAN